jgi:hypothetical protein
MLALFLLTTACILFSSLPTQTDALHAMNGTNGNGNALVNIGGPEQPPNPSLHPLRKILACQGVEPTQPSLPFDNLNPSADDSTPTIPTHHTTPRDIPPRLRPRLYGLEEAPTFYPTMDEFADPLRYIESVGDPNGGNGRAYGIVKIVPPKGWNPEFVLDQDVSCSLLMS